MAVLRVVLGVLVTVPIAVFCGLNTEKVEIFYNPLHGAGSLHVPLYSIALGFALFGALYGSFSTWLNGRELRKERRQLKKHVKSLEKELKGFKERGTSTQDTVLIQEETGSA
ncbi:MAG: LapA family protein [Alphaproteobacteria bacterium]